MKQARVKIYFRRVHGRDDRNLPGFILRGHGQRDRCQRKCIPRPICQGSQGCEGVS